MALETPDMGDPTTSLAVQEGGGIVTSNLTIPREKIELVKRTICKGATDDELALFIATCNRTGLDPFSGQIHALKRWDATERREVMKIAIGIDGYRLLAERTDKYAGQTPIQWCGPDGEWKEVWSKTEPPFAARVGVCKKGFDNPLYRVAYYTEYVQRNKDGVPTRRWAEAPAGQLAKCAEALAMRAAFPAEMGGLHTTEEVEHFVSQPAVTTPELVAFGRAVGDNAPNGFKLTEASWTAPAEEQIVNLIQAKMIDRFMVDAVMNSYNLVYNHDEPVRAHALLVLDFWKYAQPDQKEAALEVAAGLRALDEAETAIEAQFVEETPTPAATEVVTPVDEYDPYADEAPKAIELTSEQKAYIEQLDAKVNGDLLAMHTKKLAAVNVNIYELMVEMHADGLSPTAKNLSDAVKEAVAKAGAAATGKEPVDE